MTDATQRWAADEWFLERGLPAVLRPGRLVRRLWPRSAPAQAGFAVLMANTILVVAISGKHAIDIDGHAAGAIGYVPGTDVERYSAEVGYWLGESLWGRGIVTEALTMLTAYLFDEMNLLRLFALPFADNRGSMRVLEKAGFVREGILRSSSVKYGEPRDQAIYAIVNERWRATQPAAG